MKTNRTTRRKDLTDTSLVSLGDHLSRAAKARWAKKTPEERVEYARMLGTARWASRTTTELRAHSCDMHEARRAKRRAGTEQKVNDKKAR